MKDRNEWFEEVERAYLNLKIVERPYAPPMRLAVFFASDGSILVGPCESAEKAAREYSSFPDKAQRDERDVPRLRDVEQHRLGKHGPAAVPPGGGHARGQLEQPVIRSAVELYRATAWRTVPDLVSGPARRALVHGRADAPRVTAAQIGETERRARALQRDRARALKRSRKAKR